MIPQPVNSVRGMKNYWIDKRYPLAAAVRDYRKAKDALTMQILEQMFHEMALKILNMLKPAMRRGKMLDVMEEAAWDHVEKFDLRRKLQAVNYFTNVMLSAGKDYCASLAQKVEQMGDEEKKRIAALHRAAIQHGLRHNMGMGKMPKTWGKAKP